MAVLVDVTRCIGCESCSVACHLWNDLKFDNKKNIKLQQKQQEKLPYPLRKKNLDEKKLDDNNWTQIERHRFKDNGKIFTRFVKHQCFHCLEPSCASSCFSRALRVDPKTKAVVYYSDLCVGCRYCMVSCPFEIPKYEWDATFPKVMKCQFCADRLAKGDMPACVSACPTGALTFGDRDELLKLAHEKISRDKKYIDHIYGEKEVGGTSWLYISDKPFEKLGFNMNLEQTPPSEYTKSYLSKVPGLAVLWGAFLVGCSYFHHKKNQKEDETK